MPTHGASLRPQAGPAFDPTPPAAAPATAAPATAAAAPDAVPEQRAESAPPQGQQEQPQPQQEWQQEQPASRLSGEGSLSADDVPAGWGPGEPGSIYDYIRVAAFAIGSDGRISQWSDRAAEFFGITAEEAVGCDPVTTFAPRELWRRGQDRMTEILGGQEWVGTAPYRDTDGQEGVAELYLMPARGEDGGSGVVCMAVDLRRLRRIETDLAASEAVFGQAPTGFVLFDRALTVQRVNESFAEGLGLAPADLHGLGPADLLPRPEAERLQQALYRVLETGEPVVDLRFNGTLPTKPGRRRWSISLYRLLSANNRTMGVAGQVVDVTGRQRAEREAASARRSLALLNEAGAHIGSTLDLEVTAKELLDVAVPGFCDIATVDLYSGVLADTDLGPGHPSARTDGAGELRRVASASTVGYHSERSGPGALLGPRAEVGGAFCYPPGSPYAKALRTGRSATLNGPGNPDPDPMIQGTVVVPMVARDTVLGLVQLSRTKGSEPFDSRDVAIATELVGRAAVCIDNARLYRREHERALILQRSLLPPGNPAASGLEIACRYIPGSSGTEVGGDWFDVIQLPGNRTALVIGDVMGRGLRAAVAMGQLRTAVRTLAMLDLDPAEVLTALDEIARGLNDGTNPDSDPESGLDELYLATCVYAVYDAVTLRCTFANAGHLPPVLVSPGGEARMLDELQPGLPLGVGGEPFEEFTVDIPDGALLSLYTDGLVESRKHQLEEGLSALRDTLSGPTTRQLENLCDHLLTALDPHHGEDDIALLMARMHALPEDAVGDWTLPSEPTSVARARELACAWLLARGLDEMIDTCELLVSELATNALRHGRGDIRLRLLRDTTLVCEVWDNGYAQPRQRRARDTDEGGRGLQLVSMLADRWGSRRTPTGKTVWFELALPPTR